VRLAPECPDPEPIEQCLDPTLEGESAAPAVDERIEKFAHAAEFRMSPVGPELAEELRVPAAQFVIELAVATPMA
jgi:hypothetical protein